MIDFDLSEAKNTEQKEQALRKIWGDEFLDRVIFNSCKIATIESHFMRLRDSCPDGLVYQKALDRLFNFRRAFLMSELYESTVEIHHETKVPYSEFKTRMPIVPPILTSQYIEQELRRTYYPSLKRHPADTAVTLEEKTRVMIEIMGEEKLNYWIDRTFEETCEEAEKEGLRKKYPNPNDYHKELARLVAINQEKLILRLHRTARSIHYRTQQPYERVTQLVDSHEMRYDSKKFSRELLMKLRAKEQREGTCGII